MAFQNFQVGCKAEAVDDDGVWCRCTVILNENDGVTVSFDGWKSEWNRKICDASQITGSPSSKYVVYATACVYKELYGKIADRKRNCVNNYLN